MSKPTDKSIISRGGIPWTDEDISILSREFPAGGWEAALKAMPHRNKDNIKNKASKLGLHSPRGTHYGWNVDNSDPNAPQRYRPEWSPLVPQPQLPVREGSYDWSRLPSYK